ncbi:hypothetical protein ACLB2K_031464 [Fragaria x ananassa]
MMDKSWMHVDRRSKEFELGFEEFLKFVESNVVNIDKISCPCMNYYNTDGFFVEVVRDHVFYYGFLDSYKVWRWHGESMYDDVAEYESESKFFHEAHGMGENDVEIGESEDEEMFEDSNEFLKFVEDGDQPLYHGCDHTTKMNFLVKSFISKAKHVLSDVCYGDFLEFIKGLLPEENLVPLMVNDAKKTLSVLGMDYEKIHACPNDCILYRGEKFKRFQSTKTAKNLTWHYWGRQKDKMMRHLADSPTWKLLDNKYPELCSDHKNLRLALSSDEFNPHSMQNNLYSCWPVILVTYNLPPWLCMERKFMILTLLISGPKQPGNVIYVYLQPLIDDLKLLWNDVEGVYDAYRGEYFKLKAVLFWTINVFPTYGNLSGSIVRGYNGCLICVDQTRPHRLKKDNKLIFMRHRRGLPRHHPYRRQAAAFDNTIEEDLAPVPLTREELLARVDGLNCEFGKREETTPLVRNVDDQDRPCCKKSIFFQLEYWKDILVSNELQNLGNIVSETIRWMSVRPNNVEATFSGYKVNGVEFYAKQRDNIRSMQNSGVSLVADVMLVSSAKDKNPRHDDMEFYGVIQHIWEVDYYKVRVSLFKCDWVENVRCIKVDELVFTLVNLNRKGHLNDPFVLASHVKQIFFIEDPLDPQWSVVVRVPDRDNRRSDSDEEERVHVEEQAFNFTIPFVETFDDIDGDQDSNYMCPGDKTICVESEVSVWDQPRRSLRSTKATDVAQSSKDAPNNVSVGPAKATKSKKSVASKKLSFGSMSNSGFGKRNAGKSKAGTMEVVDSDDEDEELDDDEDEEESDENVTGGLRLLR